MSDQPTDPETLIPPVPEAPRLLTPKEVADILRVHVQTVRNRVADGTLVPSYRLGGVLRFTLSDIQVTRSGGEQP